MSLIVLAVVTAFLTWRLAYFFGQYTKSDLEAFRKSLGPEGKFTLTTIEGYRHCYRLVGISTDPLFNRSAFKVKPTKAGVDDIEMPEGAELSRDDNCAPD